MLAGPTTAWTSRILFGAQVGVPEPPPWLAMSYAIFRDIVLRPGYPCYFGAHAESRGELFYSYAGHAALTHLPETLSTFISLAKLRTAERNNLAVFFEPVEQELDHDTYRARFWQYLQYLQDNCPSGPGPLGDPDHPDWEFTFGGTQFFVVGVSPSYRRRRSRNLGPGMLMLFQPRDVFVDGATGRPLGMRPRVAVRDRLLAWDDVPIHPDLNVYGDAHNREWKQYFLSDDARGTSGQCPLEQHTTNGGRS